MALHLCGHKSINSLENSLQNKKLDLRMLFRKGEYVPKTHGFRDGLIDTNCDQIMNINNSIIKKAKENRIFHKNRVDGLCVTAWDGVEFNETKKDINGLPEREHSTGEIKKYIKYLVGMNVGEKGNIILTTKQLTETERITTKRGNERAKTEGETKAFEKAWKESEKLIGGVIDVHVFDALFFNQNVTNHVNDAERFFVIRLKDETRDIYKDAKGLFENRKSDYEYEIVETITTKKIKYSKKAKKKDVVKTKVKREKQKITNSPLGQKELVEEYTQSKKNSNVNVKIYKRVITKKQVWSENFDLTGYKEKVRVVRSLEKSHNDGRESEQELYVVTNMMNYNVETILKIMHLRWHIENNGFRTLKQTYNVNHIYVGNLNAINYMFQMAIMVFNLLELYTKFRLKNAIKITRVTIFQIFARELHTDKRLIELFNPPG